jgi:hypothetical protein
MRRSATLLVLAFLAAAGPAFGEQWKVIRTGTGAAAYDADSIRAEVQTGLVTINTVIYHATPQLYERGVYHFEARRLIFLCRDNAYRRTGQAILDARAVPLATQDDTPWMPVDLGAAAAFQRIACNLETPPIDAQASSFDTLLPVMADAARRPGPAQAPAPSQAAGTDSAAEPRLRQAPDP